jgi:hypothetical protein
MHSECARGNLETEPIRSYILANMSSNEQIEGDYHNG